jgi:hypothetical protein
MKPTGEDTVSALRDWLKEEFKNAPSSRLELGKFFFAVSTGSLGVLVGFKKLEQYLRIDWATGSSLLLLGISTFVALLMVIPRVWVLRGNTDLFDEHERQVRRLVCFIWLWFAFWLSGASLGTYAVLFR